MRIRTLAVIVFLAIAPLGAGVAASGERNAAEATSKVSMPRVAEAESENSSEAIRGTIVTGVFGTLFLAFAVLWFREWNGRKKREDRDRDRSSELDTKTAAMNRRIAESDAREADLAKREQELRTQKNLLDDDVAKLKRDKQSRTASEQELTTTRNRLSEREDDVRQREDRVGSRERTASEIERKNAVIEHQIQQLLGSQQDIEKFRTDFLEFRNYQRTWPDTKRDLEARESHLKREWELVNTELANLGGRESKFVARQVALESQQAAIAARCREAERAAVEAQQRAAAITRQAIDEAEELVRDKRIALEAAAKTCEDNDRRTQVLENQAREQTERQQVLDVRERDLVSRETRASTMLADARSAQDAAQLLRESAAHDLRQALSERDVAQRIYLQVEQFRKAVWPEWANTNALSPGAEELWKAVVAGDSAALWLCSQVQLLAALEKESTGGRGFAALASAIRELGRALAACADRGGTAPEDTNRLMVTWAKTLNQVFSGRALVGVPACGDSFDGLSMQTEKTGLRTINRVLGWWVKNNQGTVAWKAEVA